jgi:ketosteroid isomerase-like protein
MSEENAEIVRRSWTAFAGGGLDALAEFWDDGINWRAIEGALDDVGEIQGAEAMRRYLQDWLDTFEDITSVPIELADAGADTVIAVLQVTGRARLSGVATEIRYAIVYTLRDGKIVRGREYATRQEAFAAVGLGG